MWTSEDIHEGMPVLAPDGELLGRVTAVGEAHFELEPGGFRATDYDVDLEDVREVYNGQIVLQHGPMDLAEVEEDDGTAVPPTRGASIDSAPE